MAEEFNPDREAENLRKALGDALTVAEGVKDPTPVVARKARQLGIDILVAHCPHCRTIGALTGPGKHLCRGCFNWLLFTAPE